MSFVRDQCYSVVERDMRVSCGRVHGRSSGMQGDSNVDRYEVRGAGWDR